MKKWRPLWSYRVEETEQWLHEMSARGYHLKRIKMKRQFVFEQGERCEKNYVIDYRSNKEQVAQAGWQESSSTGKWTIYHSQSAKLKPSKEKVYKRLRVHFYVFIMLALFLAPMIFLPLFFILSLNNNLFAFLIGYGGLLAIILFVTLKFQKKERQFLGVHELSHNKKAIKKIRTAWFYHPYATKKWLMKMFEEGYELDRATNVFFYFIPKKSAYITYDIAYERTITANYFELHKEMGWLLKFTSKNPFYSPTIWAMRYEEGEEKPRLTYEVTEQLQALKRSLKFTTFFTCLLLFSLGCNVIITFSISGLSIFEQITFHTIIFTLNLFLLFLWLFIWVKSFKGYLKEKEQLKLDEVL